jgi:hypothetical protein
MFSTAPPLARSSGSAGVVHQQVEPARCGRGGQQRRPVRRVGDVAGHRGNRHSGRTQRPRGCVQRDGVPRVDDEVEALARQPGRQGPAKTAGCSRYHSSTHVTDAKGGRARAHRPAAPPVLRQ